jgi:hypothetical protein
VSYARGEDRSSFQRIESWGANTFAIMKATEGTTYRDPSFSSNWANARSEGKPRAAYHFLHPALSGTAQAAYFLAMVNAHGGFKPGDAFMVDAEILSGDDGMEEPVNGNARRRMHLSAQQDTRKRAAGAVGSVAASFMNAVAKAVPGGVRGIVYTDRAMLPDLGACTGYALFIASYASTAPASVTPWKSWTFWQKSAGGGYGGGDLDYYNGSDPADWFGGGSPAPATNWTETLVNELPTLQSGASGADVETVQGCLCARGHKVTIDGAFGSGTTTAVKALQSAKKLTQDGVVGPNTWAALLNR